ncbi:AsnC family transcriptional regulator [Saliphagus infecundisoli]|uniref:AsnC family transcriptional regulator n=1 Tax=Saliphagus infecundisoli TaxID=1849069 RepID=A0ABD5QCT2_9EURY|nr:AsnC family transcriptional regulator [Saliphagus infecundisoli]
MRGLDEIDIQILRLLSEDARRSYSQIAEQADVSQPTVTNRVERLRELGVIKGFTLDLDRSILHDGISILIDIDTSAASVEDVAHAIEQIDEVHTVYTTADSHVIALAVCRPNRVHELIAGTIPESEYTDYEIKLLTSITSDPSIHETDFSVECATCGNQVTKDGTAARLNGTLYHFCCERCEGDFREKFETLRQNA